MTDTRRRRLNHVASATRTPRRADDELMTVHDIIGELRISRRTFYRWRRNGTAPEAFPLNGEDGGELRVYRSDFQAWLVERSKVSR